MKTDSHGPIRVQRRPSCTQKRPKFTQKRPKFTQKRPIHIITKACRPFHDRLKIDSHIKETCVRTKETKFHTKETYKSGLSLSLSLSFSVSLSLSRSLSLTHSHILSLSFSHSPAFSRPSGSRFAEATPPPPIATCVYACVREKI